MLIQYPTHDKDLKLNENLQKDILKKKIGLKIHKRHWHWEFGRLGVSRSRACLQVSRPDCEWGWKQQLCSVGGSLPNPPHTPVTQEKTKDSSKIIFEVSHGHGSSPNLDKTYPHFWPLEKHQIKPKVGITRILGDHVISEIELPAVEKVLWSITLV